MTYEETPPGDRVRELIRKCEREREQNVDKIDRALRDSHAARVMATGMSWKLNFILTGVGATFAMLLGLVAWTVARVDGIEATRRITDRVPGVRVIGLSMHEKEDLANAMRDAGAKNVILLIGDGMGDSEITAARNYAEGAAGQFAGIDALPVLEQ